jgi:glycosyltransferase involved in cell wall biosynthesis
VSTFSVVIVCKNPGESLRAALASVWAQHDTALELIVIDGNSTDGSFELLQAQRSRIAVLVSEPDVGIYDAMNKGVGRARGKWVYFLGADDRLAHNGVLQETAAYLDHSDACVVTGEAQFEDGRIYKLKTP